MSRRLVLVLVSGSYHEEFEVPDGGCLYIEPSSIHNDRVRYEIIDADGESIISGYCNAGLVYRRYRPLKGTKPPPLPRHNPDA